MKPVQEAAEEVSTPLTPQLSPDSVKEHNHSARHNDHGNKGGTTLDLVSGETFYLTCYPLALCSEGMTFKIVL